MRFKVDIDYKGISSKYISICTYNVFANRDVLSIIFSYNPIV